MEETGKLDNEATVAEKIAAGITGALKMADNAVVGIGAGGIITAFSSVTGPGAVMMGTAAAMAADKAYNDSGANARFDALIDRRVAPLVQAGVESGLEAVDSVVEAGAKLLDEANSSIRTIYR